VTSFSQSNATATHPSDARWPIAADQAEHFRRVFRHLRIGTHSAHGAIQAAEMRIQLPTGSEGLLVFPIPSALGPTFPAAIVRLWHACQAEHRIVSVQNQSADPPDPARAPESCRGFHENGLGIAYGDFHVIPVQLGRQHRSLSPVQAYGALGQNAQHPLFLYEALAILIGMPAIAEQIRNAQASVRCVERIRSSLNPTDHLLKRKNRERVPEFAIFSGNGTQILLSGDPSLNKVLDRGGGIGFATRCVVATPHTYACR
jgi:hypothetical protein